uniref:Protein kinase domain-containing protein n=1 Tax=Rhabditophanes sp. KR3021 TaxID=114890 RepID=A0AC35THD1_9BILA
MPPKKKQGGEANLAPILSAGTVINCTLIAKDELTITKYLINGGFGRIYKGRMKVKKIDVCLKMELKGSSGLFTEQNYFTRFLTKDKLQKFAGKKFLGLPELVSFGMEKPGENEVDWIRFLVMPYYPESLLNLIETRKDKRLSVGEIKSVVTCLVDALHYIHSNLLSHGDIKAGNIMLVKKGCCEKVVLVDFGIAHWHRVFKDVVVNAAKHNGTCAYTSIDAHEGREGVFRSDLQILAFNIIEWIVGELPWKKDEKVPATVEKQKRELMGSAKKLSALIGSDAAKFVGQLFEMSTSMGYSDLPDFDRLHEMLKKFKIDDVKGVVYTESQSTKPPSRKAKVVKEDGTLNRLEAIVEDEPALKVKRTRQLTKRASQDTSDNLEARHDSKRTKIIVKVVGSDRQLRSTVSESKRLDNERTTSLEVHEKHAERQERSTESASKILNNERTNLLEIREKYAVNAAIRKKK